MIYFTTWINDGSKLFPHLPSLITHAELLKGSPHYHVLIVDEQVDTYLKQSTFNEQEKVIYDQLTEAGVILMKDDDIFMSLPAEIAEPINQVYKDLIKLKLPVFATDILRESCMLASVVGNPGDILVYHDADIRFSDVVPEEPNRDEANLKFVVINKSRKNKNVWSFQTLQKAKESKLGFGIFNNDLIQYKKESEPDTWKKMLLEQKEFLEKIKKEYFLESTTRLAYSLADLMAKPPAERVNLVFELTKAQKELIFFAKAQPEMENENNISWGLLYDEVIENIAFAPIDSYLQKQFDQKFFIKNENKRGSAVTIYSRRLVLTGEHAGIKAFLYQYLSEPKTVCAISRKNLFSWKEEYSERVSELDTPNSDVSEQLGTTDDDVEDNVFDNSDISDTDADEFNVRSRLSL